jgi:hypothetical protein
MPEGVSVPAGAQPPSQASIQPFSFVQSNSLMKYLELPGFPLRVQPDLALWH